MTNPRRQARSPFQRAVRVLVASVVLLSVTAACGQDEGETATDTSTTTTTEAEPSTTTTEASDSDWCGRALAAIDEMSGVEQDEIALLSVAFFGADPEDTAGLRVVGLPVDSETGDVHDKRWSPDEGLETVGPFDDVPSADQFPARVTHTGTSFECVENTEQPTSQPSPPTSAAQEDGSAALAFFRATEGDCVAYASSIGNTPPEPHRYSAAMAERLLEPGIWVIIDGAGEPLAVDLTTETVYSVQGPSGVLPLTYSFGCPPELYLGTAHD